MTISREVKPLLKPFEWREIPDPKTIDSIEEIDTFLEEWVPKSGQYQRHLGFFLNKKDEKVCGLSTQPELDALLERRRELTAGPYEDRIGEIREQVDNTVRSIFEPAEPEASVDA